MPSHMPHIASVVISPGIKSCTLFLHASGGIFVCVCECVRVGSGEGNGRYMRGMQRISAYLTIFDNVIWIAWLQYLMTVLNSGNPN